MAINIDQIQSGQRSGGTNAVQLVTIGSGSKTAGNALIFAADGNAEDSGIVPGSANGHTEILTDGAGNLVFAGGDLVYVLHVSNNS